MLNYTENILCNFESYFSRKAAFHWFVTITMGFMLRSDKLGVSSVIRDLALTPAAMILCCTFPGHPPGLWQICVNIGSLLSGCMLPFYSKGSFHVLIGDGVKQFKKGEPTPLERVIDEKSQGKILEAIRAIEMHMVLSCIAMGILQSLSIRFIGKVSSSQICYQRTPSESRVSENTLMHYFRKHFFRLLEKKPKSCITQIIHGLQEEPEEK